MLLASNIRETETIRRMGAGPSAASDGRAHPVSQQEWGERIMNIEQRTVGDVLLLSISGDITLRGNGATQIADRVRSEIQQGHNRVVLDLGRVRYVDSAGLGELVQAWSAARNRGGAMKLLNVTRRLNDLLVLTRLETVFDCFDLESVALSSFEPPAAR